MELKEILGTRRAVNFFDPNAEITTGQLKAIYDAAKLAPTSFNLQPFRIIAALSKQAREALFDVVKQPKIRDASVTMVIVGDTTMHEHADDVWKDLVEKGYMPEKAIEPTKAMAAGLYAGERGPAFASRNAGLLGMALMLAAVDMGFDTHPMDGFDVESVKKLYNLKPNELPVMLIAIGKFDTGKSLLPPKMRRDFEKVVELR